MDMTPSGQAEQQYSLRWNDYHVSILSSFRHLRDEEDFVDVTLACDGCSFTAHKVVLSACSPYFRRLLKANPCQHPIVILRDVKQRDMESLLRFMYNGEVHIGHDQLQDFLKTAQTLQVRGLADVATGTDPHRLSAGSEHLSWGQHHNSSRNQDDGLVTPPPTKRSRAERYSDSPAMNSQSDHHRDTLLGQALEGGHGHHLNVQLQSGDDSSTNDSASDKLEGNNNIGRSRHHGNGRSDRDDMIPKSEPSDYGEDMGEGMEHSGRNPYPAALLGLQGLAGLLPGPSGIHNSNQDSNFGPMMLGGELSRDPSSLPSSSAGATPSESGGVSPQCPFCGREYSSRGNLRQHINNVHYQPQQWASCDMCGKNFKTKHYLQNHKLYAHGLRQRTAQATQVPPPNANSSSSSTNTTTPASGNSSGSQQVEEARPKFRLDQDLAPRYFPLRPPFMPQLGEQRRDAVTFIPQLPHGMFTQTDHRRDVDVVRPIQAASVPPHLSLTIPQAPKISHLPLIQHQQQQQQQQQQQHSNNSKPDTERSNVPPTHAFHQPFH